MPFALGNSDLGYCPKTAIAADPVDHRCLTTMIYGEARGESIKGMTAVAYTAVNRAVKKRICQVVLAPKQYSVFNNSPALRALATKPHVIPKHRNPIDAKSWQNASKVARIVLERKVKDPTRGSTHYLAPSVMKSKKYRYPTWSRKYTRTAIIDNHYFYRPNTR